MEKVSKVEINKILTANPSLASKKEDLKQKRLHSADSKYKPLARKPQVPPKKINYLAVIPTRKS